MTDEEQRSERQRAYHLIAQTRTRVNPQTIEHIAEVTRPKLDDGLRKYVEFIGLKQLIHDEANYTHSHFRRPRSGHQNASGRHQAAVASILEMPINLSGHYKAWGDFTEADLAAYANEQHQRAEYLLEEVRRVERTGKALHDEGLTFVRELGEDRALELYSGEVANA